MIDTVELLLFLFCLLSGFGFLFHGLRKGQSLWEAFQPVALLFGLAGLTGSQVFLSGFAEGVVSLGCLIPGIVISLRHSRHTLAQRHVHLLPDADPGEMSRGEKAISKANLEDLEKEMARRRRRFTGVVAVSSLPLLGVGALYHHWPSILVGGVMLVTSGMLGRWITSSPRNGSLFEIEPHASMMSLHSERGGTVGIFSKLFGGGGSDEAKRTVPTGQTCAKCGQPILSGNMAFDSGAGRPIHRTCPEPPTEAADTDK